MIISDDTFQLFSLVLAGVIGSVLASFTRFVADNEGNWIGLHWSTCDGCGRSLSCVELIPIVSSLIFRRRCLSCGMFPSRSYGWGEFLITGAFIANHALYKGRSAVLLDFFLLISYHASLVDIRSLTVSRLDIFLLILGGIFWHLERGLGFFPLIWAGLVFSVCKMKALGQKARERDLQFMPWGEGDEILLAAAGLWVPMERIPFFLFLCGFLGIGTSFFKQYKNSQGCTIIPFIPAILASILGTVLYAKIFP